jgi:hypothetical protein
MGESVQSPEEKELVTATDGDGHAPVAVPGSLPLEDGEGVNKPVSTPKPAQGQIAGVEVESFDLQ